MNRMRLIIPLLFMFRLQLMKSNAPEENESYDDRYCTTCHGADGRGNYGVQAPRLAGMEDWYLKRQLESYRAGLRGVHPRDIEGVAMQPMAAKLTDESIAEILDWVGSWEYKPSEVTIQGDAMAGREFYSVCATCHGAEGEGNQGFGAPALAGQNDWYLVTQLKNFLAGYRGNQPGDTYGQQMAIMAQTLANEDDIINVISYINTLGKGI